MRWVRELTASLIILGVLTAPATSSASTDATARSKVFGTSYVGGVHYAWGRIRMWLPQDAKPRQVRARCHVILIWSGRGEDRDVDQESVKDNVRAPVSVANPKRRSFWVMLPDPAHDLKNAPGRWNTGCP